MDENPLLIYNVSTMKENKVLHTDTSAESSKMNFYFLIGLMIMGANLILLGMAFN